jgi:hypothetical protein
MPYGVLRTYVGCEDYSVISKYYERIRVLRRMLWSQLQSELRKYLVHLIG